MKDGSKAWDVWAVAAIILESDMRPGEYYGIKDERGAQSKSEEHCKEKETSPQLRVLLQKTMLRAEVGTMEGLTSSRSSCATSNSASITSSELTRNESSKRSTIQNAMLEFQPARVGREMLLCAAARLSERAFQSLNDQNNKSLIDKHSCIYLSKIIKYTQTPQGLSQCRLRMRMQQGLFLTPTHPNPSKIPLPLGPYPYILHIFLGIWDFGECAVVVLASPPRGYLHPCLMQAWTCSLSTQT